MILPFHEFLRETKMGHILGPGYLYVGLLATIQSWTLCAKVATILEKVSPKSKQKKEKSLRVLGIRLNFIINLLLVKVEKNDGGKVNNEKTGFSECYYDDITLFIYIFIYIIFLKFNSWH